MASGGTRLVHSREMKVIERYSELGPEGKDLAMLLLRLGRGRLGHYTSAPPLREIAISRLNPRRLNAISQQSRRRGARRSPMTPR